MDLSGVDTKLSNASRHLVDLQTLVDNVFQQDNYTVTREVKEGPPLEYIYRVNSVPEVPREWGARVGDILHNVRSALDHLAWQLVLDDGGSPSRHTYFPICTREFTEGGGLSILTKVQLRRADLIEAVNHVQPYRWIGGDARPEDHPLKVLDQLAQHDKHRLLLATAGALDVGQMWWGLPPEVTTTPYVTVMPISDGSVIARFHFDADPGPHFDPNIRLTVRLHEETGWSIMMARLEWLINWVEASVLDLVFRPIAAGQKPHYL